jgi:hypothetical protein
MPSNEQIAIVFCGKAYAGFSDTIDSIGNGREGSRMLAIRIMRIRDHLDNVRMTITSRRAFPALTQQVTDLFQ